MMPRLAAFLIVVALALAALIASEHQAANASLPMVSKADYQRCVTVRTAPLVPPRKQINGNARLSEIV